MYNPIAVTCGEQPEPYIWVGYDADFPYLIHCEWSVMGVATGTPQDPIFPNLEPYNCISFSVNDTQHWYERVNSNPTLAIIGIDQEYGTPSNGFFELADLDNLYDVKMGLAPMTVNLNNPAAVKLAAADAVVMYYSDHHAAKKSACGCGLGKWIVYEGKCGEWELIQHVWNQLNGPFGTPIVFYN